MPIVLYQIAPSAPCRAVIMTAQHLGIELVQKHVDLFAGEQMKPEFLAMNPQHSVPTIDDDGFYLWESRAIITYLVNKYAPDSSLYPSDPKKRAVVDRMIYFDIGTLHKTQADFARPVMYFGREPDPEKEEAYKKALELFETFLGKSTYAAGDHLTLADFSLVANVSFMVEVYCYDFTPYPKISAWLQKLRTEIPNYKEINEEPLQKFKEYLKSRNEKK